MKKQSKTTVKEPAGKSVANKSASAEKRGAQPEKVQTQTLEQGGVHAVKLVKIKNKYMFNPTEQDKEKYKPNGTHTYIVFKDDKGQVRAIRTTHLYEKKKQEQINKQILIAVKLPRIKFPSGVRRGIITEDITGEELDLAKVEAVNINGKRGTYLSKRQAAKIIKFASQRAGKKKKP